MVLHTFTLGTQVQCQHGLQNKFQVNQGLHSETLSQNVLCVCVFVEEFPTI